MFSSKKESRYSPTPDRPCLLAKGKGTLRLACNDKRKDLNFVSATCGKDLKQGTKHLNNQLRKQLTDMSNQHGSELLTASDLFDG